MWCHSLGVGGSWIYVCEYYFAPNIMLNLPAGFTEFGPKIGSPDSRFHVMFGFGEPFLILFLFLRMCVVHVHG